MNQPTGERDSMTAATSSMTARTTDSDAQTLTASATSALVARSMHAVERITDTDQRRVAFARHMETFPPTIGRL